MLRVCKFGGSSLASPTQFEKVKNIICSNDLRKVVVVSAVGKEFSSDYKVTDLLYLLAAHIRYKVDATNIWNTIFDKYQSIKLRLGLKLDLNKEFDIIKANVYKDLNEEYLVSRGEYLSALLMSEYLGYEFVDSKDLLVFDYHGKIDEEKSKMLVKARIQEGMKVVVPGFYGANPNGTIHLFSRGGSDITGSLLASYLNASIYENFTDVNGILVADPKIIKNPKKIIEINYDELRELSYMGASVIHEETIFPVQALNIPLHILNTNNPSDSGTVITKSCSDTSTLVTGITGKKEYLSLTIEQNRSSKKIDVILSVLDVFKKYNINFEHLPTSIDSFSVVIEKKNINDKLYEVIGELNSLDAVNEVVLDSDIALVAVVGRNMIDKPGISGKIFSVLGENDINIKMICQTSTELTIIIGVCNEDFNETIEVLYESLV